MKLLQAKKNLSRFGLSSSPVNISLLALSALSTACAQSQFRAGKVPTTDRDFEVAVAPTNSPAPSPASTGAPAKPQSNQNASQKTSQPNDMTSDNQATAPSSNPMNPSDKPVEPVEGVVADQQISWENAARDALIDALLKSLNPGPGQTPAASQPPKPAATPQPVCHNATNTTTATKPLDIVFSIDVSTSMGPYINVVKDNVVQFATILSQKGIDVQFSAVGFVDKPVVSIGFTNAANFQSQISQWNPLDLGNVDFQEGGQLNLEHSLWLLLNKARMASTKMVVHVSDAIVFAGENHNDFSTTQLGMAYAAAKPSLGSLFQFFDSVPSDTGYIGAGLSRTKASFSPRDQMNSFRSSAGGLGGKSLSFPFSATTLTQELPSLIESKVETVMVCK